MTTTTITTTVSNTQTGTALSIGTSSTSYNLGNYVTDVSLLPYIESRIVSFKATNIRPNTIVHAFFDNVLVDQYCAPATANINYTIAGTGTSNNVFDTSDYQILQRTGNWGDPITSNANGVVFGQFSIPAQTFRTGDHAFEIADVTSIALGNDAITTFATSQYTASNISVTKQNLTLSTVNPTFTVHTVANTVQVTTVANTTPVANTIVPFINNYVYNPQYGGDAGAHQGGGDPLGQIIPIQTGTPDPGVFISAIDVFFKQKSLDETLGVTLYLTEVKLGLPDSSSIIPFSSKHLRYDEINTSADGTVATKFVFDSLVYLNNNTSYAFVLKPDSSNPDYQVFMANLGDLDIATGVQVYAQPTGGNAVESSNGSGWTILQTESIKYNIYFAQFTTNAGTAFFENAADDFLAISNVTYTNLGDTIKNNDIVYGVNYGINFNVFGTVYRYIGSENVLRLQNSSGNFNNTLTIQVHRLPNDSSTPSTSTLIATANLVSVNDVKTNAVVPQFATIIPSGASLTHFYKGTSNTYSLDTSYVSVLADTDTELYDYERLAVSATNENLYLFGNKSLTSYSNFHTDSPYISPVIDLIRKNYHVVANQIDLTTIDYYDEFYNYGPVQSKEISKPVVLADGQDAEDIQILVTAYRPAGSELLVYVKFLAGSDSDTITNKTWTPLINQSSSLYSDFTNIKDMKEYVYTVSPNAIPYSNTQIGTISVNGGNNIITGIGTDFTKLTVGRYILVGNDSRKISFITNSTSMAVATAFSNTLSFVPFDVISPPMTAYLSEANDTSTQIPLPGTVSVTANSSIVTGTGTKFNSLAVGSEIQVGSDTSYILNITSDTVMAVQNPFTATLSGANIYDVNNNGVTYYDSNSIKYTSFKTFQIKLVYLSDSTARVPLVDDVRAIALQL